ncbi:hypothetical protein [Allosphingosinicella sp.]|uniref:hypothetical protein n=1 Tax=Allosphingosinicella sp. TaxID=2823234 RepID=UPI00378435D4
MRGLKRTRAAVVAGAMMTCMPVMAQAQAACWNPTQVAAAKVRDLQSRLMVATLRCSAMGVNVAEAYNRFLAANRETIRGANAVLMSQFESAYGRQAQVHYDRFATALANIYGDDATSRAVCAETAVLAGEAAEAGGNIDMLVAIEDRLGFVSALPGGQCTVSFAGR